MKMSPGSWLEHFQNTVLSSSIFQQLTCEPLFPKLGHKHCILHFSNCSWNKMLFSFWGRKVAEDEIVTYNITNQSKAPSEGEKLSVLSSKLSSSRSSVATYSWARVHLRMVSESVNSPERHACHFGLRHQHMRHKDPRFYEWIVALVSPMHRRTVHCTVFSLFRAELEQ